MKKKFLSVVLAVMIALSCCTAFRISIGAAQSDTPEVGTQTQFAQSSVKGAAILHCFNWSYTQIKNKLPEIAAAGYTAVQTSPVQKPKSYKSSYTGTSDQWWKLYQPLTLSIADGGTWLGTKAELTALCSEAEQYNIQVIVDIVANHMANNTNGGGYSHLNSEVESDMKNSSYFHSETYGANDDSRYDMTHGHIGMPDLNTANSHVQQRILSLLKECVDCGVDGFRFDAAKHIELPTDDSNTRSSFWSTVINGIKDYKSDVFCYGEILNTAKTSISNYTTYMCVTDNKTGNNALSAANSGSASSLASSTYNLGAGASNTVLWAESHDTYMDDTTSGISNQAVFKTWAIVGARAKSTSLYLARPNSTMGLASSDGGWKSTVVTEVNKFKNYFMGQSESLSSSGKVAYIERGTSGVSIAKLDGAGSVSLTAKKMADGTYLDHVSGNTFTVSGGTITGTVGEKGVAVVYNVSEQPESTTPTTTVAPSTTVAPTTEPQVSEVLIGDADMNGKINVNDITAVQRYLADIETYPYIDDTADCNNDEFVNIEDITLIQQYLCEFADSGYVGQIKSLSSQPSGYKVYFDNTRSWSGTIYCYYWSNANTHMVSWPGKEMTYEYTNNSGHKVYSYTVPADINYVIFSNNSSQTVNIPFDGTQLKFYAKSTKTDGKYDYGTW